MQLTIHVPDDLIEKVKDQLPPSEMGELETVALDAILDFLHLLASGGGPRKGRENAQGL